MKYSYLWLQKHIEEKLPDPEALKEKIIFHAFEVESAEEKGEDVIFDIKVLPDRAGDCLSHYGMAREIAGLLQLTLKNPSFSLPEKELALNVEIKHEACTRYIAVQMDGVTVRPSPAWLALALESVGQRSINAIVDATNYILLDTGQPTHAFDAKKIDGGIIVRGAHPGETIITLTEEKKELNVDNLVIADYLGAIAIAGVKGGKTAEIDRATTSIILEVANFDAVSVRKTSRSLNLITDASKRFENNFSPVAAAESTAQLIALIQEVAGGEVIGIKDSYPKPRTERSISFVLSDITRILGNTIILYMIEDIFDHYHYTYKKDGDTFVLTVPYWREDITGAHDIAEEIGRVNGYDNIPSSILPFTPTFTPNETFETIRAVKKYLHDKGFSEIVTYTFRNKGEVYVLNGNTEKSALRTNLSEGLKESFELNRLNAPLLGQEKIRLFEIGTVFFTQNTPLKSGSHIGVSNVIEGVLEVINVATVDDGAITELSLETFVLENNISTSELSLFEASIHSSNVTTHSFSPWSLYPFITRDIAVWVENTVDKSHLESTVLDFAKKYCAQPAYIIDEFIKEGKTSIAFRLIFQDKNKTLTNEEVSASFSILTKKINSEKAFTLR